MGMVEGIVDRLHLIGQVLRRYSISITLVAFFLAVTHLWARLETERITEVLVTLLTAVATNQFSRSG